MATLIDGKTGQRATASAVATAAAPERRGVTEILFAARLVWPLVVLVLGLLTSLLVAGLLLYGPGGEMVLEPVLLLAALASVVGLVVTGRRLRRQLLGPLARLQSSVAQVCQGEPNASVVLDDAGVLGGIVRDIDSISEELTDLYEDMDNRVNRQTTRLAQKTASLKILYDVAASINNAKDLDDLLIRFLRVLKEMVNGRAATVRVVMPDGKMRLVGSIGLDNDLLRQQELYPVQLCVCGTALAPGDILCEKDPERCSVLNGRKMFGSDRIEVVTVPLEYHDEVLGVYTIFIERPGVTGREDILELLQTIGSHLGMAVAKQRSDEEARRLSIVEERTALAHELHDSLAQTLASLRFQVRMLNDTLLQGQASSTALDDVSRIRNGLDEAHTELRELLNSFRAPVEGRGLLPALEKITERFGEDTGIHVFLQASCRMVTLTAIQEMQVVRIVQEALANIRKHARAQTVRVLLTCRSDGAYLLLVEDDGVGFDRRPSGRPGEHIGLSIMKERARRMGGDLRIESEPGEGTRVEMIYHPRTEAEKAGTG
jgi:two-component system nitrate/nitrite sensor histidine kinase NarX